MTNQTKVTISGRVSDFEDAPLNDAVVEIRGDRFRTIYETRTDDNGEYRIPVEKGLYLALVAYRDYKTKYLEYWAWNVPAYQDLRIDPHIGGIEVYAMNAFMPQGAYPSLMIYFRPMSLKRSLIVPKRTDTIDISPVLSEDDIDLRINGIVVKILELNRVKEYAGGISSMIAYLTQSTFPRRSILAYLIQSVLHIKLSGTKGGSGYLRIDLALRDKQTGERGEGCLFWKRRQAR